MNGEYEKLGSGLRPCREKLKTALSIQRHEICPTACDFVFKLTRYIYSPGFLKQAAAGAPWDVTRAPRAAIPTDSTRWQPGQVRLWSGLPQVSPRKEPTDSCSLFTKPLTQRDR